MHAGAHAASGPCLPKGVWRLPHFVALALPLMPLQCAGEALHVRSAPHTFLRGRLPHDILRGPKWTRESTLTGSISSECGTILDEQRLPACSTAAIETFRNFSYVMTEDPQGIFSLADSFLFLGNNHTLDLKSCIATREAYGHDVVGIDSYPLRVVLDSEYVNRPRCCHGGEISGLVLNDTGGNSPWTMEALRAIDNMSASEYEVMYLRVQPKQDMCNDQIPCPLSIQVAGAAGNPWFLVQAHCEACSIELGAVLIAPILAKDLFGPQGEPAGTSSGVLSSTFLPFVQEYIATHREIDPERVYLVAQSQGDDTALRAAMLRPDLFSMVSLSGKLLLTNDTFVLLEDGSVVRKVEAGRLRLIQFNVGDRDEVFDNGSFFESLRAFLAVFRPGYPHIDMRIFPESYHGVWWAAWNSLHDVIWTGRRSVADVAAGIPLTCAGAPIILDD